MTMEIESKEDVRYLCDLPEHVSRKLVCTRAAKGYSYPECLRVEQLKLDQVPVEHHWVPMAEVIEKKAVKAAKPIPKEETTSSVPVENGTVYTEVKVDPERWYCHAYEHRRLSCAIDGYVRKPEAQHTKRGDGAWVQGKRSVYISWRPASLDGLVAAVEEEVDELVTTGEYLHGKSNGQVFTPPTVADLDAAWNAKQNEQHAKDMAERAPDANAGVLRYLHAGTFHNDPKVLAIGDYVLVRGKVTGINDHGPHVSFQVRANEDRKLAVKASEIICWVRPPLPPEPHTGNLLVSESNGLGYDYREAYGDLPAGWAELGIANAERRTWEDLWTKEGPFREYYASRMVREQS